MKNWMLAVLLCTGCMSPPDKPVHSQSPGAEASYPVYDINEFVDEGTVASYGLDTKSMGSDFPKIKMYGFPLEYREETVWYYFAGTNYKAYWLPVPLPDDMGQDGKVELRLLLPARYDADAKKFQFLDRGKWVDTEPPCSERLTSVILQTEERFKKKPEEDRQTRRRSRGGCFGGKCFA